MVLDSTRTSFLIKASLVTPERTDAREGAVGYPVSHASKGTDSVSLWIGTCGSDGLTWVRGLAGGSFPLYRNSITNPNQLRSLFAHQLHVFI